MWRRKTRRKIYPLPPTWKTISFPPRSAPFIYLAVVPRCLIACVASATRCDRGPVAPAAEACAHAASNLTNTDTEFVRQALVAPETVAEVLEILYLGGGGEGGNRNGVSDDRIEGQASGRGSKRAAACRLNSARVLRSIFSKADGFDVALSGVNESMMRARERPGTLLACSLLVDPRCQPHPTLILQGWWLLLARLVQLGFLVKLGHFFGQALAQKDSMTQGLLAHSAWHLSMALADTKPIAPPPQPVSPAVVFRGEENFSVLSASALQEQQHHHTHHTNFKEGGAARRSSTKSVASNQGISHGPRIAARRRSSDCSSSAAEASTAKGTGPLTDAAPGTKNPSTADRAESSMSLSRMSNCTGLAQMSPLFAARAVAAREAAKDQRPGATATAVATTSATAAKRIGRKSGRSPSGVTIEEGRKCYSLQRSNSAVPVNCTRWF